MWLQFFSQDAHFAIDLFAALVGIAVTWLYFDAWLNNRNRVGLLRWLGFGIFSLSFIAESTVIEQSVLGKLTLSHDANVLVIAFRLIAYLCIIASQVLDPLQPVPKLEGLGLDKPEPAAGTPATPAPAETKPMNSLYSAGGLALKWGVPLGGLVTAGLYWRRATTGLERHLKALAVAFLLIGLSDFVHLANLLRTTSNPNLYSWVAAFGPIWWLEQVLLIAGVAVLGKWVWSYLTERFFSQLFMILVSSIVVIFLVVSVVFTGLLINSVRSDEVSNIKTAAQVLSYALASEKTETLSGAQELAGNPNLLAAITAKDHNSLNNLTSNYLVSKGQSSLIITDAYGEVLLRGENPARWGDSLSNDAGIRRALLGGQSSSTEVQQGVVTPSVLVSSSVPVVNAQNQVVGSVTTGMGLSQAFVDGLQSRTGLQVAVYGGKVATATTFLGADNKTHLTGIVFENNDIMKQVLSKGHSYNGSLSLNHQPYLGSVAPLNNSDNVPIGMLVVAEPQTQILLTAGKTVELTFALTAILLALSIAPAYGITKNLTKQLGHN